MDQFPADSDYFRRRSSEEQAAAGRASDPRARRIHSDLAERYAEAARAVDGTAQDDQAEPAPAASIPLFQSELRILP